MERLVRPQLLPFGCGSRFSMVFWGRFCPLCLIPSGMGPSRPLPAFPGLSRLVLWEFWPGSSTARASHGAPHPARSCSPAAPGAGIPGIPSLRLLRILPPGDFSGWADSQILLFSSWELEQGVTKLIPKFSSIPAYGADPRISRERSLFREGFGKSPQAGITSKTFPSLDEPRNFRRWNGINPSKTSRLFSGKRIPEDSGRQPKGFPELPGLLLLLLPGKAGSSLAAGPGFLGSLTPFPSMFSVGTGARRLRLLFPTFWSSGMRSCCCFPGRECSWKILGNGRGWGECRE